MCTNSTRVQVQKELQEKELQFPKDPETSRSLPSRRGEGTYKIREGEKNREDYNSNKVQKI